MAAWPARHAVPRRVRDREQLLRTIVHELVHVRQVRAAGAPQDSVDLAHREREAYAEEAKWWQLHLEQR